MFAGEGIDYFSIVIVFFVFLHTLIDGLQRLGAVGTLRESLDLFHGGLWIVGIGLGGIGTCDRGFFRTVGCADEPLAGGEVVFLCPPSGEFEGTFFRYLVRHLGFCKPVEPLSCFADSHFLLHVLGGSGKFIA